MPLGGEEEPPHEVLYIDKALIMESRTFSVFTRDSVREVGSHILGDLGRGLTALQRAVVPCEVRVRMAL